MGCMKLGGLPLDCDCCPFYDEDNDECLADNYTEEEIDKIISKYLEEVEKEEFGGKK